MTYAHAVFLFIAALLSGAINSVAGGGSFLSFPALLFVGVPAIPANATNTIAVWPGSVASMGAYREELGKRKDLMWLLGGISVLGGWLGAMLLLHTPPHAFQRMIPWLLLLATLLFSFGGMLTAPLRRKMERMESHGWITYLGGAVLQMITSIYGGYFGAGIGILMLATLALMGEENIHEMNALKVFLATVINGMAVITFIIAKAVWWREGAIMIVGAVIGGYWGAWASKRVPSRYVRGFVMLLGYCMSAYFFLK